MRDIVIALVAFALICSCESKEDEARVSHDKYESLANVFHEVNAVLENDNGQFWNHNLNGPILLVDPETREIVSNQNNISNSFRKLKQIYIDTLPKEVNIANTALDWEGKRWTMVMLPLPKEQKERNNLIVHELFHRIQPKIGFSNFSEQSNIHLDSYLGRLLLKLELEALVQATQAFDKDRMVHIENALRFRAHRQTSKEIINAENTLELNEGLAEYTGIMMSNRNDEELKRHFKNSVSSFYKNKTFVRSFAYQTIPMYGYLLAQSMNDWHNKITNETNLVNFLKIAFSLNLDSNIPFETLAKENDYQYDKIQQQEQSREKERIKVIANYQDKFLNKPTLKLVFENMNISFDPRNIIPIKNMGTVYPTLRISDNWGVLSVENGALLSSNWQYVIVTEPDEVAERIVTGDGWQLELDENWKVETVNASYRLRKK